MSITALASWYGSNRMLAPAFGKALTGCEWVGVPFAGGMCELKEITARTVVANDLHKLMINLARVTAHPKHGPALYRRLRRKCFHPEELAEAQAICQTLVGSDLWDHTQPDLEAAEAYFVCAWMARNATAGTDGEFNAGLSVRWNAGGGDSVVRFRNATKALLEWRRILERVTCTTLDAFEFLDQCKDAPKRGIYCDPPFPGPGDKYRHKFGVADHKRLAERLTAYKQTRIVCRFYDHEMVRDFYQKSLWHWHTLTGRKQTNDAAPEVLLVLNGEGKGLFDG